MHSTYVANVKLVLDTSLIGTHSSNLHVMGICYSTVAQSETRRATSRRKETKENGETNEKSEF